MSDMGCYKCTDRKPHCHSTCQRHIERTERHRAELDKIRARRDREHDADAVGIAGRLKAMKRKGVKEL
jgi:hypothetical protein